MVATEIASVIRVCVQSTPTVMKNKTRKPNSLLICKKRQWEPDLEDGKSAGGGRLTDDRMNKLQQYYGITSNKNLSQMPAMSRAAKTIIIWHSCSEFRPQGRRSSKTKIKGGRGELEGHDGRLE